MTGLRGVVYNNVIKEYQDESQVGLKMWFMRLSKVERVFVRPKGITANS